MSNKDTFSINAQSRRIGQLFKDEGYVVPAYQRHYAWGPKQREQLFSDLYSLHKDKRESHFLGSVVLVRSDEGLQVVDGQQRLATLSMLFAAIVSRLEKAADPMSSQVRGDTLSSSDYLTRTQSPKLKLNRGDALVFDSLVTETPDFTDNQIRKEFQSRMFTPGAGVAMAAPSSRNLIDAYSYFQDQLTEVFSESEALVKFLFDVLNKVQVVQIIANNDEAAYSLFETLNDRGIELTVSDLIKNHLYSLTRANPAEMHGHWEQIEMAVGTQKIPEFLRHNYISQHGNIQKDRLFRELKQACIDAPSALKLVKDMHRHAELYKSILAKDIGEDLDIPDSKNPLYCLENMLEGLSQLKVTASLPILISTYRVDRSEFAAVLKALVSHAVRYYTLKGGQSGRMGGIYADLAHRIIKREESPTNLLRDVLNQPDNTLSDDELLTRFQNKNDWDAAEARWVLGMIEIYQHTEFAIGTGMTLEHVLPTGLFSGNSTLAQSWDIEYTWDKATHADYVWRIGNLTLLHGKKNSALGRMSFEDKLHSANGYKSTSSTAMGSPTELRISQYITAQNSWSPEQIEERGRLLGEIAAKVFII